MNIQPKDLKILSERENYLARTINYIVEKTYLNDRKRLSPVLLGIVGSFSLSIFGAYVGLHLEDIGTTAIIIGVILALRNIYQLFLRVPLAQFSQMIGRKPLLIAGVFFYASSLLILSFSYNWIVVLIATTLLAIGMSCFWPVIFAYIGDFEKNNIGQMQGRVFQGTDFGTIIGALLAYLLLKQLEVQYRVLFGWSAGVAFAGAIALAFFIPEVLKKEDRLQVESRIKALGSSFLAMFRNLIIVTKQKRLALLYLFQFVLAFMEYMVVAFIPFLIVNAKGFTNDTVAQILWITAGVLIFFKPYMGSIIDRLGYKKPVIVTLLVASIALTLIVYVDLLPVIIILYIIYSASTLTAYLGMNTGATRASKPVHRGIALGALGFYVSAGRSMSTLILSPIWEKFDVNVVFISTAIAIIAATIILSLFSKFFEKSETEQL